MRQRLRSALVAVVLAAVGGGTATMRTASGRFGGEAAEAHSDIPTIVVSHGDFVRRVSADGELRAVTATPVTAPTDGGNMRVAWLAPDGSAVRKGDVVVRLDQAEAAKAVLSAQLQLTAADATLKQQRIQAAADVASRDIDLETTTDDVDEQRKYLPRDPQLVARNDIIKAQIDLDIAAAKQAQAARAARAGHGLARASVQLAELDRQKAELALHVATVALSNLDIRAPSDGVLVLHRDDNGDVPKPGTSLWSGEEVGAIPNVSAMEAELFVLELDGDGLEVGQPADIVLVSRPETVVHGKIRLVDKLAKRRVPMLPVQYFSVTVALGHTDAGMKPGQRVRGELAIAAQHAIAIPRQAVVEKDGRAIVYRRDAHGFAPVTIELGPATAGRVVVKAGLADGDVIALRDPQEETR
jgi:hypothetical protein